MINCSVAFNVNALRVGTDSDCVRQASEESGEGQRGV